MTLLLSRFVLATVDVRTRQRQQLANDPIFLKLGIKLYLRNTEYGTERWRKVTAVALCFSPPLLQQPGVETVQRLAASIYYD